jgi:hypothetical protein
VPRALTTAQELKAKWGRDLAQVVENLPNKHKALNSNRSSEKDQTHKYHVIKK